MGNNKWYLESVEETLKGFSSQEDGLEKEEVERRLKKFGRNKLHKDDSNHPVLIFFKQFNSGLIYVLMAAAFIAWIFDKHVDAYVILAIILLNAIMGFVQEYKAERAIKALAEMMVPTAKVYREGEFFKIAAEKIVPGDIVFLEEGDKVPADMRLFDVRNFRANEAPLTGESVVVNKKDEKLEKEVDLGDRKNMAWMGTFVVGGRAKGIVTSTGDDTMFGAIAKDIGEIKRGGGHFEKKISILTKRMAIFAFAGASLIFTISLSQEGGWVANGLQALEEPLFSSIAALVSGIPEGLPAILVIVLAVGATRMAGRNAIIRRLPATETLGVADHIISDKTGTITQNTMTVREMALPGGGRVKVTGEGFDPKGYFYKNEKQIIPLEHKGIDKLLHIAEVCNNARLAHKEGDGNMHEIIGDPTEGALVVLSEKAGIKKEVTERDEEKIDDMPFNSKMKLRASLVKKKSGKEIYAIGAPESIIKRAEKVNDKGKIRKLNKEEKKRILSQVDEMSEKAMRTIALAYREVDGKKEKVEGEMLANLILVGVVGMIDPPRAEVRDAVKRAHDAGIRVVMCTGDHKGTAAAIASEVSISRENESYPESLEESELKSMSDEEFKDAVENVNVFARLTPQMKRKIARVLQEESGATIAMTGDGVNDAPAVKQADIGISMGIMGTDVTKEAGDIVLADDNFASIVNAIEEGRIVFENTRKSSSSLLSSNFAEMGTLITFLLMGLPLPLLPTQILWVNLVTDGVVGVPLALEPKHEDILKRPPRDKNETILTFQIVPYFILMTVLMVGLTFFVFNMLYEPTIQEVFANTGDMEKAKEVALNTARTGAFTVIALTQLYGAINLRSIDKSIFKVGFFSNKYMMIGLLIGVALQFAVIWIPPLQEIFHFETLPFEKVIFVLIITSLVFWVGEIYKYIHYRVIRKES